MWLIVLNCILVVNLAIWGPVNETFRAKFVLLREELGEKPVMAKARSLMVIAGCFGACLVAGIILLRYPIARLLAPAYDEQQLYALATMLAIVTPSLVIDQFNNFCISLLNAYQSFFVPEISNGIAALVNIIAMVLLAPHIGIYALAVSYYIGLGLMFLLVVREVFSRKVPLFEQLSDIRLLDFTPFFYYALPFFVPYFFIQVNLLIEKSLGNVLGEGVVSMLDYSRKFVDIPINVLTSVLLTMLVPVLSTHFAKRDTDGFLRDFRQIYQFGLLIVTALIAFFCSSSTDLIALILYHKEQMSPDTIIEIGTLSRYYAWSALVNFFYIIFGLALLATNKGKIYAFFGVIAQFIMIALNFIYFQTFGAFTFPLSFIAAHSFAAIALFSFFPYNRSMLLGITVKYLWYLVFVVFGVYLLDILIEELSNTYIRLTINSCFIVALMVILLFILRLEERLFINTYWQKMVGLVRKYRSKERED